jgi:hypothetical protein
VDYLHPRTSMLMFGPKNATAKQIQYLYLPEHKSGGDALGIKKVHSGAILTATQFEGIPMADVFEVLQYWTFHSVQNKRRTVIRVGVGLNILKTTLLKGQILTGVKEELAVLAKQWCDFSVTSVKARSESRLGSRSQSIVTTAGVTGRDEHSASTPSTTIPRPPSSGRISEGSASVAGQHSTRVPTFSPPQGSGPPSGISPETNKTLIAIAVVLLVVVVIQLIALGVMYFHMKQTDGHMTDILQLMQRQMSLLEEAKELNSNLTQSSCPALESSPDTTTPLHAIPHMNGIDGQE